MAHLLQYKKRALISECYAELLRDKLQESNWCSFELYIAAKILQKYIRGFLTRNAIKKWHKAATIIQKTWRGYKVRVHCVRYARLRYYETRNKFYNDMAARIQRAWQAYKTRKDPCLLGSIKFFKQVKAKNEEAVANMKKFHDDEIERMNDLVIEEKKKWLRYVLPKLHHYIRTKTIPGIYSTRDGGIEYSMVEKLLASFDFRDFLFELKLERKQNTEMLLSREPSYKWKGSFKQCEKAWKLKNILENPLL